MSVQLAASAVEMVDHRSDPHPRALLENLRGQEGLLIWAEGKSKGILAGQDRLDLLSTHPDPQHPPRLVIWTAPPGRGELQAILAALQPREVDALRPRT